MARGDDPRVRGREVASGNYAEEGSLERSKAEFDTLQPNGLQTEGHEIRSMVDDAGQDVGYVWFTIEDRPVGRVVFIYDIAVDPEHRRKGHAQAALVEVEAYAREHACVGVMLHVFGVQHRRPPAVPASQATK